MTILEFLAQDHVRLRKDLAEIRRKMPNETILKREISKFVRDLELHETVEMKFLVAPAKLSPVGAKVEALTERVEYEHQKIWEQIGEFLAVSSKRELAELRASFSDFLNLAESHIKMEEEVLYPMVLENIDGLTLEELGRQAEKYVLRFRQESMSTGGQS